MDKIQNLKVQLQFQLTEFEAKLQEAIMKLNLARDLIESAKQAVVDLPDIGVEQVPTDDSGA